MQQKATLPAERLAVDRIFTPQNSGIAVWTEKKKWCCVFAVSGDVFQVTVYRRHGGNWEKIPNFCS